jgi:hypothetical protein
MISYNYPITKEKIVAGEETDFEKLENNFYEFYNGGETLTGKEPTRKDIFNGLKTE